MPDHDEPKPVPGLPLPEPPMPVALRNLERLYESKRLKPRDRRSCDQDHEPRKD